MNRTIDADGTVCLRNCPYDALVADHRDVTCGMNLAWAEGVIDGLRVPGVRAELAPDRGAAASSSGRRPGSPIPALRTGWPRPHAMDVVPSAPVRQPIGHLIECVLVPMSTAQDRIER